MDIFKDLRADKFRSFLSLLGVSIGIFSIVAVMTLVDALQKSISEGFASFGSGMLLIQTIPLDLSEDDDHSRWWDYLRRPQISVKDYRYIVENVRSQVSLSFIASFSSDLSREKYSSGESLVAGVTGDWRNIIKCGLWKGREFSQSELTGNAQVVIIGRDLYDALFPDGEEGIGSIVRLSDKDLTVIGVFEREGNNMVSLYECDALAVIPYGCSQSIFSEKEGSTQIAACPTTTESEEMVYSELKSLLRSSRRLSPSQEDNFSICSLSFIANQVDELIGVIDKVGILVGAFSLLIGAFGIANIMFVSVKERTPQIGIKKALGARKRVIMRQFLAEAAVLSLFGGLLGIMLAVLIALIVPSGLIKVTVSVQNALVGMAVSLAVGLIAGVIPAGFASNLNPVRAINDL